MTKIEEVKKLEKCCNAQTKNKYKKDRNKEDKKKVENALTQRQKINVNKDKRTEIKNVEKALTHRQKTKINDARFCLSATLMELK